MLAGRAIGGELGLARPHAGATIVPRYHPPQDKKVHAQALSGRTVMEDPTHPQPDRQKLLVTGVDGMVGANLALSLANRFDVLGLFERHPVSLPGCRTAAWEPAAAADWAGRIRRARPRWIIHCGPMAAGSWDVPQECPDGAQEAGICALLAKLSGEVGGRLTVISTDAVFAGPRLFHDETAPATSRRAFARAAGQAEQALEGTAALVVRTHAYGWSPVGAPPGFAERVWQSAVEAVPARFDPDRHATPILAGTLAELLWLAYRRGLEGRYHITGAERTSAYRFAVELAGAFGLQSCALGDPDPLEDPCPDHLHETSLSTRRARRDLRRPMPMLREGLEGFAEQAESGFRARLQGCTAPPAAAAAA